MKTGSISINLIFPQPWPVTEEIVLIESNDQGKLVSINALISGAISFTVSDKTGQLVKYISPLIKISGDGQTFTVIAFVWEEKQPTRMYINGTLIDDEPVNLNPIARNIKSNPASKDHPKRLSACAQHVEERRKAFTQSDNPSIIMTEICLLFISR